MLIIRWRRRLPFRLTVDVQSAGLDAGETGSSIKSLAGQRETVLLPRYLMGQVGHGHHPTVLTLEHQQPHQIFQSLIICS